MDFDPVLLARLQFAFTIAFHIIFPSFTIGLSAYIATLHVTAWLTGRDRFLRIARFWTKIFAVSFGMGVVSGVVLSYELGTNWSRFSRVAGNVVGPLPATRCSARSSWRRASSPSCCSAASACRAGCTCCRR